MADKKIAADSFHGLQRWKNGILDFCRQIQNDNEGKTILDEHSTLAGTARRFLMGNPKRPTTPNDSG